MSIVLLGPQRRPSLDKIVNALGLPGPFVTITAGWQEREKDDADLDRAIGWTRTSAHVSALNNLGGRPNDLAGSI